MGAETNIKTQLATVFPKHNYKKTYQPLSIVHATVDGETNFYQATKPVPRFTAITDTRYWKQISKENEDEDESDEDETDYLCFTAAKAGSKLCIRGTYGTDYDFPIEYSFDKIEWQNVEFETSGIHKISSVFTFENIGDKIYFRADSDYGTAYNPAENIGYFHIFGSGPGSSTEDNVFAVSGDLQTLVSKDGKDKTKGCFFNLFSTSDEEGILITSAPKLTATKPSLAAYAGLFYGQYLLEEPAEMVPINKEDLPAYCYQQMYSRCTSLTTPADLNYLTIDSFSELETIYPVIMRMYDKTTFDITDDGTTINGMENIEFPIESLTSADVWTAMDFANILGNLNGFPVISIFVPDNYGIECTLDDNNLPHYNGVTDDYIRYMVPSENVGDTITITIGNDNIGVPTCWQTSENGDINWTDIENSNSKSIDVTVSDSCYYRPFYENESEDEEDNNNDN